MSLTSQLYRLQRVDSEWEEKSQHLAVVESSLGESGDLIRAREAVDETEGHLGELRKQSRALELEVASLNGKLKENQERLYGGRVRNPKELGGLQEEASALRRRRSDLEDGQLELMIAIEGHEAELAERQARLRQIEGNWREEQAAALTEKQALELSMAELAEDRDEMRSRIGAAGTALYDDLRRRLGSTAVVLLKKGICQGCMVDVPTVMARAVERGEGIHYCPICNRLLHGG